MGAANSTGLVDCVVDGDIQQLKTLLHDHGSGVDIANVTKDSTWDLELEQAVHTVVASELESGQHLQQLQIALELLLHVRPEAWSSTASSQDSSENDDDTSATSNSAGWSACHRACATGNLAFVAFVLQHYPLQFDLQIRDAFGLFPIDLVPPELLMSQEEIADNLREEDDDKKPGTPRSRRCLALQRLRARKFALQELQIRTLLRECKTEVARPNNQDEEDAFYVTFEPRREHLSLDQACNLGHVHERGALLRVKYRVPRAEPFLNGYFQLIWRELGDPRSEEPHYDPRFTRLRDENAQFLAHEAPISPQELQDPEKADTPRSIDEPSAKSANSANWVVEGCFSFDVAHLPADSVCHVLFITCDRQLLHRTIALSSEGLAVQLEDIGDPDSDDDFSDSTSDEDDYQEDRNQEQEATPPGYTFFVGGEEFSHPNSVFAGQSFADVDEFETFLRDLRAKKQRRVQQKQQQEAGQLAEEIASKGEGNEVRPPEEPTSTEPSNQDDNDA